MPYLAGVVASLLVVFGGIALAHYLHLHWIVSVAFAILAIPAGRMTIVRLANRQRKPGYPWDTPQELLLTRAAKLLTWALLVWGTLTLDAFFVIEQSYFVPNNSVYDTIRLSAFWFSSLGVWPLVLFGLLVQLLWVLVALRTGWREVDSRMTPDPKPWSYKNWD